MKDNYAKTYRICMTRGHEGGNHFALVNHILLFYKRILKFNSWIHALKEMSATFTFYLHFIYILFTFYLRAKYITALSGRNSSVFILGKL